MSNKQSSGDYYTKTEMVFFGNGPVDQFRAVVRLSNECQVWDGHSLSYGIESRHGGHCAANITVTGRGVRTDSRGPHTDYRVAVQVTWDDGSKTNGDLVFMHATTLDEVRSALAA